MIFYFSEGGGQNRRHSSGSSLVEALDEEEQIKLSECLDYILDIVGDTIPELQSKIYLTKVCVYLNFGLKFKKFRPGNFW